MKISEFVEMLEANYDNIQGYSVRIIEYFSIRKGKIEVHTNQGLFFCEIDGDDLKHFEYFNNHPDEVQFIKYIQDLDKKRLLNEKISSELKEKTNEIKKVKKI